MKRLSCILLICLCVLMNTGFAFGARARQASPRIVINIPAGRLRVYRGDRCVLDCRTAVGRLKYPRVRHNTRTRVGKYRITSWSKDHRSRDYPTKWSVNNWRGAFGSYTARIGPRSGYQHIHGTIGPVELGELYLVREAPREKRRDETMCAYLKYLRSYEYGLSHGCTRVSNENIEKLRNMCPVGTPVRKIYCLHEHFETEHPWEIRDIYYPNIYHYKIAGSPVFYPDSGRLEGYRDPPDAIGYY